jgi:stage V sporulation protein D (sporulation-specific penicillin-binding protein)
VFKEIMTEVMRYWNIPPQDEYDLPQLPEEVEVPSLVNLTMTGAIDLADATGFGLRIEGQGELIVAQTPKPGAMAPHGTTIIVYTGEGQVGSDEVTVPSLDGLSLREASELLAMLGLRLESSGSGIALSQDPPAGTKVKSGSAIRVNFGVPGTE